MHYSSLIIKYKTLLKRHGKLLKTQWDKGNEVSKFCLKNSNIQLERNRRKTQSKRI